MEKIILSNLNYAILLLILFSSCSPRVSMEIKNEMKPLDRQAEVVVLGVKNDVPNSAQYVGKLNAGNQYTHGSLSDDCDYPDLISSFKIKSRDAGANLLKLHSVKGPNWTSECMRIEASMYYVDDPLKIISEFYPQDLDNATIHFIKPNLRRSLNNVSVILHEDGSKLGHVMTGFVYHHKVPQNGKISFYAETNTSEKIVIDVEKGKEYFILIEDSISFLKTKHTFLHITRKNQIELMRSKMIQLISKNMQ